MKRYYLLSATGPDRPGIVAAVTENLFKIGCNIEDSSMMRLGSEFGIMVIFTSSRSIAPSHFTAIHNKFDLNIGVRSISKDLAQFKPLKNNPAMVVLHGFDRPGLVFKVTSLLAKRKFNITDLSTHRTKKGGKAGYILFIEGELPSGGAFKKIEKDLRALAGQLKVQISLRSIVANAL